MEESIIDPQLSELQIIEHLDAIILPLRPPIAEDIVDPTDDIIDPLDVLQVIVLQHPPNIIELKTGTDPPQIQLQSPPIIELIATALQILLELELIIDTP
jgi:hypothetical protein